MQFDKEIHERPPGHQKRLEDVKIKPWKEQFFDCIKILPVKEKANIWEKSDFTLKTERQ